jgi:hypothetical protein
MMKKITLITCKLRAEINDIETQAEYGKCYKMFHTKYCVNTKDREYLFQRPSGKENE